MRIIICDNNQDVCVDLHDYIEEYFKIHKYTNPEIVIYHTSVELLEDTGDKEIVFLGIDLPGTNGIQLGKELKRRDKRIIIFIVAGNYEYLDDAMKIHVFRYLTKPINKQRLFRNLRDAMYKHLIKDRRIVIESDKNNYSVRMADIICIQTGLSGEGVMIHTRKRSYKTSQPLTYWEKILDSKAFFRPHRSNIINMEYVTQFNRDEIKLYNDQFTTYMARRQYTQFKKMYLFFLESKRG